MTDLEGILSETDNKYQDLQRELKSLRKSVETENKKNKKLIEENQKLLSY